MKKKREEGFSLIEAVIALGILSALFALSTKFTKNLNGLNEKYSFETEISALRAAIMLNSKCSPCSEPDQFIDLVGYDDIPLTSNEMIEDSSHPLYGSIKLQRFYVKNKCTNKGQEVTVALANSSGQFAKDKQGTAIDWDHPINPVISAETGYCANPQTTGADSSATFLLSKEEKVLEFEGVHPPMEATEACGGSEHAGKDVYVLPQHIQWADKHAVFKDAAATEAAVIEGFPPPHVCTDYKLPYSATGASPPGITYSSHSGNFRIVASALQVGAESGDARCALWARVTDPTGNQTKHMLFSMDPPNVLEGIEESQWYHQSLTGSFFIERNQPGNYTVDLFFRAGLMVANSCHTGLYSPTYIRVIDPPTEVKTSCTIYDYSVTPPQAIRVPEDMATGAWHFSLPDKSRCQIGNYKVYIGE